MFNIVLVHPQIPPNTGSIGRLCVNIGASLHLVEPLGFAIDDRQLRRAGLDYWKQLSPTIWPSLEAFLREHGEERLWLATTKVRRPYFEAVYRPGDYLLFGSETAGLPADLLARFEKQCITIPMKPQGRSLNLALSAGVVAYEAVRQNYGQFGEIS